jgi:hypothetical protein
MGVSCSVRWRTSRGWDTIFCVFIPSSTIKILVSLVGLEWGHWESLLAEPRVDQHVRFVSVALTRFVPRCVLLTALN